MQSFLFFFKKGRVTNLIEDNHIEGRALEQVKDSLPHCHQVLGDKGHIDCVGAVASGGLGSQSLQEVPVGIQLTFQRLVLTIELETVLQYYITGFPSNRPRWLGNSPGKCPSKNCL